MKLLHYRFILKETYPSSDKLYSTTALYLMMDSGPLSFEEELFLLDLIQKTAASCIRFIIDTDGLFHLNPVFQKLIASSPETLANVYILSFQPQAELPLNRIEVAGPFYGDYKNLIKSLILNLDLDLKIFIYRQPANKKFFELLDLAAENNSDVFLLPRDHFDGRASGNQKALKEGCLPVFGLEELIQLISGY